MNSYCAKEEDGLQQLEMNSYCAKEEDGLQQLDWWTVIVRKKKTVYSN